MQWMKFIPLVLWTVTFGFAQANNAQPVAPNALQPETPATQQPEAPATLQPQAPATLQPQASATLQPEAQPAAPKPVATDSSVTVSVFVKKSEDIRALQDDLKTLQTMAGGSNAGVDSLLKRANYIAEMNDRCAAVSINELLDTTCGHFYEVELPAFENKYMELTGEIRLGSMHMATNLQERIHQLGSCTDALVSIVVSRDQLLRLQGNMYLEPINLEGDFDTEYQFTLSYDQAKLNQQQRLANLWIEKCGPIVVRQSGEEFAPVFIATLKAKNDSLKKSGSNVKLMINKKILGIRVDMRRPVKGAYFLNGVSLFEKTLSADKSNSHLKFDIKNKKAILNQPADANIETFKGRQTFAKLKKPEMIGRWVWDSEKLPDEVVQATPDESETMTAEDSLALKQSADELEQELQQEREKAQAALAEQAAADAAKKGDSKGIRWIPLAISAAVLVGGAAVAVLFDNKAKSEKETFDDELAMGDDSRYSEHNDNAKKYQRNRTIGIGAAALGAIGVVLSFVF